MDAADNKSKRHAKGRGKSINAQLIFENQTLLDMRVWLAGVLSSTGMENIVCAASA
jgi:hypothetical protein